MFENPEGDYVLYEDAVNAIEAAKVEAEKKTAIACKMIAEQHILSIDSADKIAEKITKTFGLTHRFLR